MNKNTIKLPCSALCQLRNEFVTVLFHNNEYIKQGQILIYEYEGYVFKGEVIHSLQVKLDQLSDLTCIQLAGIKEQQFKESVLKFYEGKIPGAQLSMFQYQIIKKMAAIQQASMF